MRIAATGFVEAKGGSVASANALLLRLLLDAGHEVDFFSKPSFVDPRPVVGENERFRFISTDNARADRFRANVQHVPLLGFMAVRWDCLTYVRLMLRNIRCENHTRRYDLCLWLGTYAPGRVMGLPTVSFAQGAPGTDARSIISRFGEIRNLAGLRKALIWRVLATLRLSILGLPRFRYSDHIIVGSEQSKRTLHCLYGIPDGRVSTLPYPIDLDVFKPQIRHQTSDIGRQRPGTLRVLWLGRIIPRKRLDVFLGGVETAIRRGSRVTATIVGGVGFVPGYERMIEAFPFPDHLRWIKNVPRDEVPALLHANDVLVQPSDEENFGSSVAEAQACGLPVIVGRTNGNQEYLCGRDIYLNDDRPNTLATALIEMSAATERGGDSWRESRKFAENTFAPADIAHQLEHLLELVASGQRAAQHPVPTA